MEEVAEVRALQGSGLEGCAMRGRGVHGKCCWWTVKRWLMELSPGIIRENITTRGINVNGLDGRPATSGGNCATGDQHGVHSVRHARKNQAWPATEIRGDADAVPVVAGG